jgi:hypothetical protein
MIKKYLAVVVGAACGAILSLSLVNITNAAILRLHETATVRIMEQGIALSHTYKPQKLSSNPFIFRG